MLDLGSTEFHLAIPSVPGKELRDLSSSLFDSWEAYVESALSLRDYSLFLQTEEGSVRGLAKIGAALGVIYVAIGNYGDFISGINTITQQVSSTSEFLSERASKVFTCPDSLASTKRHSGTLGSIQRLFVRVQKGELSPEEATARVEGLLGDESAEEPNFLKKVESAFHACPRHHEQQRLPFQDEIEILEPLLPMSPKGKRVPRPTPLQPPELQLRVEVWRDSKRKRKHTRLVTL